MIYSCKLLICDEGPQVLAPVCLRANSIATASPHDRNLPTNTRKKKKNSLPCKGNNLATKKVERSGRIHTRTTASTTPPPLLQRMPA